MWDSVYLVAGCPKSWRLGIYLKGFKWAPQPHDPRSWHFLENPKAVVKLNKSVELPFVQAASFYGHWGVRKKSLPEQEYKRNSQIIYGSFLIVIIRANAIIIFPSESRASGASLLPDSGDTHVHINMQLCLC